MSINLDQETTRLIEQELRSGRFRDAASFVDVAIRHYLLDRDLREEYTRAEVEAKIERGIASLDRGEEIDGEQFMADLTSQLGETEARKRGG